MKEMKRILALFLCLVMLVGVLPVSAFAAPGNNNGKGPGDKNPGKGPDKPGTVETVPVTEETVAPSEETTPVTEETTAPSEETTPVTEETTAPSEETTPVTEETEPPVIAVSGITLDQTALEVGVGAEPVTLVATVLPEDAADKTVTWTSSEPGVAAVADGVLTFGYMGEAVITAAAGEFSASCVVTVGEGEWDTYEGGTVVIAGSDYQQNGTAPKDNTQKILEAIQDAYPTADGFIFGGDYSQKLSDKNATTSGIDELKGVVEGVYGTNLNEVFVQGNHDAAVDGLTDTGKCDTDDYGVFVINEDDFSSSHSGSSVASTTMLTDLKNYLNQKVSIGYSKPVFVATHLPLHVTSRGDNTSAVEIFNLLNAAGASGLNIIFLFGHNHSQGYDAYLGNGAIYLPKGSSITVAGGSTSTLNFTYMNNGYVGYVTGSACTHLTMTTFEISDTQVIVKRYDANGEHTCGNTADVLKAAGVASGSYKADTTVVNSGAIIKLTTPTVGGDNEGGNDEAVVEKTDNNVTVSAPGITGLAVTKAENPSYDTNTYSAYASYDITPADYVEGTVATVSIVLDPEDGFVDGAAFVIDRELNRTLDATIDGGILTFETDHFSVYDPMQLADTSDGTVGNWVMISDGAGKTIYKLDEDGTVDQNVEYLIVAEKYPKALSAAGSNTASVVDVELEGDYAYMPNGDYGWVFTSSGTGYTISLNGETYLGRGNNGLTTGNSSSIWSVRNEANGAYYITQSGRSTYYVRWSNSSGYFQASSRNDDPVRLYKYESAETGEVLYAALSGSLSYVAASEAQILNVVKAGINVLTSNSANGADPTTLPDTDSDITWTVSPGDEEYKYNVSIAYKGKILGTVTVNVPDETISTVTVEPAAGEVERNGYTVSGAQITVTKTDGTTEGPIAVTIGMLKDANGNDVSTRISGVYTDLSLYYKGHLVTDQFVLTIKAKEGVNHPNYPNEGAVKVDKTAHGIDFQASGVAQVEVSASGVPMNQGVDVLLILDTSSSMGFSGSLTDGSTRIDVLKDCVNELISNLKEKRADGSDPDIDIAVVHFNGYTGNKNLNYIETTARTVDTLGGQLTDGWVDVQTLGDNWAENIPDDCSGTNYDHGLLMGYELLAEKQESDPGRQQFVMFLSDGAPFQYNGVNSNSTNKTGDWANWLLGNLTTTQVENLSHVNNPEYYYGPNNGNGQKHRVAEAIKGTKPVKIVTYSSTDSSGTTSMVEVPGLGATMYTVGLALEATNMPLDAEGQATVLRAIASKPELSKAVTSAAGLQDFFDDFSGAILLAAENARFVDQMGANYDIQIAPHEYLPTGETEDSEKVWIHPSIEILSYDIYTKAEADASSTDAITTEMIGNRKGTSTPIETVFFQMDGDELKAYSNKVDLDGDGEVGMVVTTGADGKPKNTVNDADDNILIDGIICADTFWYNTTSSAREITGVAIPTSKSNGLTSTTTTNMLPAETFYWKVGKLQTSELAMRYYVYLTESLDGDGRDAGSYATNEFATLYYDNYLGNSCYKDTVSPTMAWEAASVSYAFYLVNSAGNPVNMNGVEVPFAQRVTIVQPTLYDHIRLNTIPEESVKSMKVITAEGQHLPQGYTLYDNNAQYRIFIHSNATGQWQITWSGNKWNDSTASTDTEMNAWNATMETVTPLPDNVKAQTTYVTGYNPADKTLGSNEVHSKTIDEEFNHYDYTNTVVWFAVRMEPNPVPDTIVVDYGLPVDVHVLVNDMFGDHGKLIGVASADEVPASDSVVTNNTVTGAEAEGRNGIAALNIPASGATTENSLIRYKLGMQFQRNEEGKLLDAEGNVTTDPSKAVEVHSSNLGMKEPDVFTYAVDYKHPDGELYGQNGIYHGTLTVIPATTIYYEDDYVDLVTFKRTNGTWDSGTPGWGKEYDETYQDGDITQAEDRPDDYKYGFGVPIDANNIYGYDQAYDNYSQYSLGSAAKLDVNADTYGTATFTFWGTGFDVISQTSSATGALIVDVYEGASVATGTLKHSLIVDTYYGYVAEDHYFEYTFEDGKWVKADLGDVNDEANAEKEVSEKPKNPENGDTYVTCEHVWTIAEDENALYQIPVMNVHDLPYGQYTVEINAGYAELFDHNRKTEDDGAYELYLDAIRIYDPTGNNNDAAKDAYKADGEGWPTYFELRNNVIGSAEFGNEDMPGGQLQGITFIDGVGETASVADYVSYGPNNELYLASGQAIVFAMNLEDYGDAVENVHLGIKSADGNELSYAILDGLKIDLENLDLDAAANKSVTTSTDMYYDITDLKDSTIVIYNSGEGIMSITNVKITFNKPTDVSDVFYVDYDLILGIINKLNQKNESAGGELDEDSTGSEEQPVYTPYVSATIAPAFVKTGAKYSITGESEYAETVTVNEKAVDLDSDGKWVYNATAGETAGTEKIHIVATNGELKTEMTLTLDVYSADVDTSIDPNSDNVIEVIKETSMRVTVKTSSNVEKIVVDDVVITNYRNRQGLREWVADIYPADDTTSIDVKVYNAEGMESVAETLNVKMVEPTPKNVVQTVINYVSLIAQALRGLFGW